MSLSCPIYGQESIPSCGTATSRWGSRKPSSTQLGARCFELSPPNLKIIPLYHIFICWTFFKCLFTCVVLRWRINFKGRNHTLFQKRRWLNHEMQKNAVFCSAQAIFKENSRDAVFCSAQAIFKENSRVLIVWCRSTIASKPFWTKILWAKI